MPTTRQSFRTTLEKAIESPWIVRYIKLSMGRWGFVASTDRKQGSRTVFTMGPDYDSEELAILLAAAPQLQKACMAAILQLTTDSKKLGRDETTEAESLIRAALKKSSEVLR